MTSTSSDGSSVHYLAVLAEPRHRRSLSRKSKAAINAAQDVSCPATCRPPPVYSKSNPADAPILTLALTSKTVPLSKVQGPGGHAAGAEDLAAARGRSGQHQRRPEGPPSRIEANPTTFVVVRSRPRGRSAAPSKAPASIGPRASFDGPPAILPDPAPTTNCWRADDYRSVVIAYRNGAPRAALGRSRRSSTAPRTRSRRPWMNDVPRAIILNVPAPAGREHHPGRRPHHEAPAAAERRRSPRPSRRRS